MQAIASIRCLGPQLLRVGLLLLCDVCGRHVRDGGLVCGAVVARGRVDACQELTNLEGVACGECFCWRTARAAPDLVLKPGLRFRDSGRQLRLRLPLKAGQIHDVTEHPAHHEGGLHSDGVGQLAPLRARSLRSAARTSRWRALALRHRRWRACIATFVGTGAMVQCGSEAGAQGVVFGDSLVAWFLVAFT